MNFSFCFPNVTPVNLNNCYMISSRGGKIRRFPNKEYKELEQYITILLKKEKNKILQFNAAFNEDIHYLKCEYRFYFPFITKDKKKRIRKRYMDLSNLVKPIEDIIFKNLMADDAHIVDLHATKIDSLVPRIEVLFSIGELRHID